MTKLVFYNNKLEMIDYKNEYNRLMEVENNIYSSSGKFVETSSEMYMLPRT